MGTETDRNALLDAMFLAFERDGRETTFGFYRSKEGREFLRRLFRPYLRRQNMGEGKAATIIADSHPNPDTQASEVDKTKSALRRWGREGQSELWPKDAEKNLRQMRRLENEFISVSELKEVLADTAETIQKQQSGVALSLFFYGSIPPRRCDPQIEKLQEKFSGLYRIITLRVAEPPDQFEKIKKDIAKELVKEVRAQGLSPNTISVDPQRFVSENAFFDTYEVGGYRETRTSSEKFVRFSRVKNRNFMLAQFFEIKLGIKPTSTARKLSTGFAFPLLDGTVHIFLTNLNPPTHRTFMSLSPDATARPYGKMRKEGDHSWRAISHPFSQVWESNLYGNVSEFWEGVSSGDPVYEYLDVDKLSEQLDRTMWNFLP